MNCVVFVKCIKWVVVAIKLLWTVLVFSLNDGYTSIGVYDGPNERFMFNSPSYRSIRDLSYRHWFQFVQRGMQGNCSDTILLEGTQSAFC